MKSTEALRRMPTLDRKFFAGVVVFALMIVVLVGFVDRPVHDFALSLDSQVQQIFLLVTEIGNSAWSISAGLILVLLFRAVVWRALGRRQVIARRLQGMAGFVLTSILVSGISISLIKNSIGRARPNTFEPAHLLDFSPFSFDAAWASFPSGHSTTSMSLAVALCLLWPRLSWLWLLIGFSGALSRVMLGVHWPSDAVAGCAYGAICTLAVAQGFANRGWVFTQTGPAMSGRLWRGFIRGR